MKKIACFIGILALIAGCSAEPGAGKAEMDDNGEITENIAEVIATEKRFPADFHEIGFHREESSSDTYLIKQATEQDQYEEQWTYFRLQKEAPEVDMDVKSVWFFSLEESSTCPYELKEENIQVNPTTKKVEVEISPTNSEKEECTLDAAPRTFVIKVTKEASPFEEAVIYKHETETIIPIK